MVVGEKYGRLTCIGKDTTRDKRYYLFKCDCGNVKSIIACNVQRGASKSCGCYSKEHPSHTTFGFSHTRLDNIYKSMLSRCYIPNNNRYANYGGRGIKVCDEWKNDKTKFFEWAFANGYNEKLTIDRIDVDKDYCPENCRWATYTEQANNKSNSIFIEAFGVQHTYADWARIMKVDYKTFYNRVKRLGWSVESALLTPTKKAVIV